MEEFYKYFSWFFVIVVGGIGGVRLLINHLIQTKIKLYFDKQLEEYKNELAIITKNAEYDISKKLFDFEAYASKKHTVYPELYSLAFESWSELSLFNHRFDLEILGSRNDLDTNTLKSHFHNEFMPTSEKLAKAYRYFYKNELYLSKDAAIVCNESLEALRICGREIGISFRSNSNDIERQRQVRQFSPLIDVDEKYLRDAEEKIHMLKETIREELSYSHSEKPTEQKEEALS